MYSDLPGYVIAALCDNDVSSWRGVIRTLDEVKLNSRFLLDLQ